MSTATIKCSSSADIISAFCKHDDTGKGTIEREVLEGVLTGLGFECGDVLPHFASRTDDEIRYRDFVLWICGETSESDAGTCKHDGDVADKVGQAWPTRLTPSSAGHLNVLQQTFPFQCYIEDSEHRGISLSQLNNVFEFVSGACSMWYDVAPPESPLASGNALSIDLINLYHINTWVISPATLPDKCAFVELLSVGGRPQTPDWFVCHWYGQAVASFLECLKLHSNTRELGENAIYWIFAYANRQHSSGQQLVGDPLQASFYKAMESAQQRGGLLLVLDEGTCLGSGPATPFKRIWCAFEESIALKLNMLFDIVASHDSRAYLLADGVTKEDMRQRNRYLRGGAARAKAEREKSFPIEVIRFGLMLQVEQSEATRQEDKVRILNCLTGAPDLDCIPASTHPVYDQLNIQVRATLAVAGWRQAIEKGLVEELCLRQHLFADVYRDKILMDFTHCKGLDDPGVSGLAQSFPPKLKSLDLCFAHCDLSDLSVVALADNIPPSVEGLSLKFELCANLTDASLHALAPRLCNLGHLHLDFRGCRLIGDASLQALAVGLPVSLEVLKLRFSRCALVSDAGLATLARGLPPSLSDLDLQFERCRQIGDEGMCEIARTLPGRLSCLSLNFEGCSLGDSGLVALIGSLPQGVTLHTFSFRDTCASDELLQQCESVRARSTRGLAAKPRMEDQSSFEICGTHYKEVKIKGTRFDVKLSLELVCVLNYGSFGMRAVFKDAETGSLCTVKKFADAFSDFSVAQQMLRDVKLQMFLKHDNVLGVSDIYPPRDVDFDVVYIIQPYMEKDLDSILRSKQVLATKQIQYILLQILRGLRYVHSAGVVHCDIKPTTLLVDTKNYSLRITAFGNARSAVAPKSSNKDFGGQSITRWYHSPEHLLSFDDVSTPTDIWSVGCILGEMYLRKPLFQGKGHMDQLENIIQFVGSPSTPQLDWVPVESTFLPWLGAQRRVPKRPWSTILNGACVDAFSLFDLMLTFDPRSRADAMQCLRHVFFVNLYNPSDDLEAPHPFDWQFQRSAPSKRSLQNGIYIESSRLHPELLTRDEASLGKLGILSELFRMRATAPVP